MSFKIFTSEQFDKLVDAQSALNEKYNGKNWENRIPVDHFNMAILAEVGELLESGPRVGNKGTNGWKWWIENLENDEKNLKIEAVDILHFALSSLIIMFNNNLDDLKTNYDLCYREYSSNLEKLKDPSSRGVCQDLSLALGWFIASTALDETQTEQFIDMFVLFMNSVLEFANLDEEEAFNLYMKKNELNLKRVQNGYKEGKYQKVDENGVEDNMKLFEEEDDEA